MAFRRKWTKTNLSAEIELLPEPRYLRREVSPEMAQILIRNASTARAKALIAAAAYTGMRLSEVLRIDPADIQDGAFKVLGKNGEVRFVPVPEELKPHLKQFPIKAGWRNVYRGFERARKKAGLTLRFPHAFACERAILRHVAWFITL
jgi:integrase